MKDKLTEPGNREDLVIAPGGSRPKTSVHSIRQGEGIRFDASGKPLLVPREAELAEDLVLTPGGFRHRSLVHQMEPGRALFAAEGGRLQMMELSTQAVLEIAQLPVRAEDVPALGSGWIAYTYWNNGTGLSISTFRTTWEVPPIPATQGSQTIFLFSGIQNYGTNFGILQPVLQWGSSAAGGGPFWSVASWYVTFDGHAFHTSPVPVSPGDTLTGVMTLDEQSGSSFSYTCSFDGIANTSLPIQNIAELLWCNETLEAYQIDQCSDYPATASMAFRGIDIQTGGANPTLNWTPVNAVTDCGQHAVVIDNSATNGEVDIFFQA